MCILCIQVRQECLLVMCLHVVYACTQLCLPVHLCVPVLSCAHLCTPVHAPITPL